jgi:hypothetical protein
MLELFGVRRLVTAFGYGVLRLESGDKYPHWLQGVEAGWSTAGLVKLHNCRSLIGTNPAALNLSLEIVFSANGAACNSS